MMLKLKDILLKEYVQHDLNLVLKTINANDDERIREAISMYSYHLIDIFVEEFGEEWGGDEITKFESWIEDGASEDRMPSVVSDEMYSKIIKYASSMIDDIVQNESRAPLWYFFSNAKIVKNTWLTHSTNSDAFGNILHDGFSKGISVGEEEMLGLSTHFGEIDKSNGGYNFAFDADNCKYVRLSLKRYGDGAHLILFRASGVQAFHEGDDEYQVIFLGETARDFVFFVQDGGEWMFYNLRYDVNDSMLPKFENICDGIEWVERNYDQYRKIFKQPKKK
jgi:hypothetical protein